MKQYRKALSLFLLLLTLISLNSRAQTKSALLDVYKIDFRLYIEATDTSHASAKALHVVQEQQEKAQWKTLQVYAHPEYLYAEDRPPNNEKTNWQIQYKTKSLMQLQGKTAYPMNFDGFLYTNVYAAGEPVTDSTREYGIVTLSEDTMTVAGYLCQKAVINYTQDAGVDGDIRWETVVWYCPKLPEFYLPSFEYLQKIPGAALLIWSDRGFGERRGVIAQAVVKQKKPASFFTLPKGTFIMYPPSIK